jgi:hypothetical protein
LNINHIFVYRHNLFWNHIYSKYNFYKTIFWMITILADINYVTFILCNIKKDDKIKNNIFNVFFYNKIMFLKSLCSYITHEPNFYIKSNKVYYYFMISQIINTCFFIFIILNFKNIITLLLLKYTIIFIFFQIGETIYK